MAGVGGQKQSFPTWFFDYDNDGWEDLFVAGFGPSDLGGVTADYLGLPNAGETLRLHAEALLDRARSKHGELADLLLPVFEEGWRQAEITRRRTEIKSQDHRFLLALLLNVPERATVLRLVQEKFPEQDAVELVVSWVRELSATKIFGSKEPSVLGSEEFGDRHLLVFRGLLEGLTVAEIEAQPAAEPQSVKGGDSAVAELASHLKTLPLFKSIFQE